MAFTSRIIAGVVLTIVMVACGNTSNEQQTLDAFGTDFNSRMDNLHATATVGIEEIVITVEHVGTDIARARERQEDMLFTLESRGVDISILPGAMTPVQAAPVDGTAAPTPSTESVNVVATAPPVTPAGASVQMTPMTPTETVTDSLLSDITLSTAVGDDDCATNATNRFTPSTQEIYIVATARDVPADTTLTTVWLREAEEVARYDFTYETIEEACIWFFVDQTDFLFTPGAYSVQFFRDGEPESAPLPFTIADDGQ